MIYDFDELLSHAGHELECVYYGTKNQAINAAIECITCGAILIDLDPGDTLSKELARRIRLHLTEKKSQSSGTLLM